MPSSMPTPVKPRPYRRFAYSALHTRFVFCAALSVIWHLCLQGFTSDWYQSIRDFFWAFFPFGYAGLKALLFSVTSFLLYLLQIGTLNTGRRCTPSKYATLHTLLFSWSTYLTFLWYLASAFWFSIFFAYTAPPSQQLRWTTNGGYGAPDRLNERPIYLRVVFLCLAFGHAWMHLHYDLSSIPLNNVREKSSARTLFFAKTQSMITRAALYSTITSVVAPFLYHLLLRRFFWWSHVAWARLFANIPRSESNPPTAFYISPIFFRGLLLAMGLSLTWQLNIVLFQIYMLQEPSKSTVPLSAASKDPNGTLLNGLSAKSQIVKTLAFWELDLIAKSQPDRRKSIFSDFERPMQGPVLTSIVETALSTINCMQSRIEDVYKPAAASPPSSTLPDPADDPAIQRLPRILPDPRPARDSIYQQSKLIARSAKKLGTTSVPMSPPSSERAQRFINDITQDRRWEALLETSQQSLLGRFFLATTTRSLNSTVLGTPIANPALIMYAVSSSTSLLVASLQEDAFGRAVQCVPSTVQTFTASIRTVENYLRTCTNGGYVSPKDAAELQDLVLIVHQLKSSLRDLLDKFQMFLGDVGLSIRDLNEAQKAATERPLFTVIEPEHPSQSTNTEGERKSFRRSTGPLREMEEPGKRKLIEVQRSQQQLTRRHIQREEMDSQVDKSRPGRLFSQLDDGSGYQDSLRKRRNSTKENSKEQVNPLASGGKKRSEMSDNVLGARDFGSLPSGGLQRRRAGEAR